MAVLKYGLIVTEIKGKVNGQVFQQGNNAKILRTNSNKKNSKSPALSHSTSLLAQVTSQYKLLSNADRLAWATAALTYPFTDKFRNTYYGNAFQCFTSYNRNLLTIGSPMVTTPNIVTPATNVGPFSFTSSTKIDVTIQPTTVLGTSQFYLIYASPAYSQGRNNNNATFKQIAAIDMNGVGNLKLNSFYNAVFGSFISDSKVIFKIIQVNPLYPFLYFPYIISTVIL